MIKHYSVKAAQRLSVLGQVKAPLATLYVKSVDLPQRVNLYLSPDFDHPLFVSTFMPL